MWDFIIRGLGDSHQLLLLTRRFVGLAISGFSAIITLKNSKKDICSYGGTTYARYKRRLSINYSNR